MQGNSIRIENFVKWPPTWIFNCFINKFLSNETFATFMHKKEFCNASTFHDVCIRNILIQKMFFLSIIPSDRSDIPEPKKLR